MCEGAMATASFWFRKRGGSVSRWLTIMTSTGEDLDILGGIYCNAPRREGEDDESLRLRCLQNWRDDDGASDRDQGGTGGVSGD